MRFTVAVKASGQQSMKARKKQHWVVARTGRVRCHVRHFSARHKCSSCSVRARLCSCPCPRDLTNDKRSKEGKSHSCASPCLTRMRLRPKRCPHIDKCFVKSPFFKNLSSGGFNDTQQAVPPVYSDERIRSLARALGGSDSWAKLGTRPCPGGGPSRRSGRVRLRSLARRFLLLRLRRRCCFMERLFAVSSGVTLTRRGYIYIYIRRRRASSKQAAARICRNAPSGDEETRRTDGAAGRAAREGRQRRRQRGRRPRPCHTARRAAGHVGEQEERTLWAKTRS